MFCVSIPLPSKVYLENLLSNRGQSLTAIEDVCKIFLLNHIRGEVEKYSIKMSERISKNCSTNFGNLSSHWRSTCKKSWGNKFICRFLQDMAYGLLKTTVTTIMIVDKDMISMVSYPMATPTSLHSHRSLPRRFIITSLNHNSIKVTDLLHV